MNDLLHDEIKRYSPLESECTQDPSSLNIDNYLEGVDPLLVDFTVSVTRTVRERQRSSLGRD